MAAQKLFPKFWDKSTDNVWGKRISQKATN
jgi:hypothetical protein